MSEEHLPDSKPTTDGVAKTSVNVTGRVQILCTVSNLAREIENGVSEALHSLLLQVLDGAPSEYTDAQSVAYFLDPSNRTGRALNSDFLNAILLLSSSEAKNESASAALTILDRYFKQRRVSAHRLKFLKRYARLLLITLWVKRVVLLPSTFTPRTVPSLFSFDGHELIAWFRSYEESDLAPSATQKDDARRLLRYGLRLLFATRWHKPEDVSLAELAELHRCHLLYQTGGHPNPVGGAAYPWSILPAELWRSFPTRVTFTEQELSRFSTWMVARAMKNGAQFEDWRYATSQELSVARAQNKRSTANAPRPRARRPAQETEPVAASLEEVVSDERFFELMAKMKPRPRSVDWRKGPPVYPGRQHLDVDSKSRTWLRTFKAWLNHRENVEGCRSDSGPVSALNALADYLFGYLPFWFENHPGTRLSYPNAPKFFTRFAFCVRYEDVSREEAPATLLQMLRLRRSGNSLSEAVRTLSRYFTFIGVHYQDDDEIAGKDFRSPLEHDVDVPRGRHRSKSNKAVIPKRMFGYLLFYSYAIEHFGERLLRAVISRQAHGPSLKAADGFRPSEFGERLFVPFRGEQLEVEWVPNLFTWQARTVRDGSDEHVLVIPHLTALRLCQLGLENGLRFQSGQWLDIRTWDSRNNLASPNAEVFELYVNTDKTMVNPWETLLFPRTREMLLREQRFQHALADYEAFEPVEYEGKPSPFGLIKPLFRAPTTGKPIDDNQYYRAWRALLSGFESFYATHTGEVIELLQLRGVFDEKGHPLLDEGDEDALFCVMRFYSVFTPHSCRTTFVTHRQGVMPLEFIAGLVGHGSPVPTAHYSKPEKEDIVRRSVAFERDITSDFALFDATAEGVHVRADKKDAALRKAFSVNRDAAVKEFHFLPGVSLWSTDRLNTEDRDGLALLRAGPMSRIVFRETHVCPVGEECPDDVVRQIGDRLRCGLCPLAMKCIDHLTAISAKKNQLKERIRHKLTTLRAMQKADEPPEVIDAHWAAMELDVLELLGWTFSEEALSREYANATSSSEHVTFMSERPDIIKRHLEKVSRREDEATFLLRRLAETNAYPSMGSERVHALAVTLKRKLLAGKAPELLATDEEPDAVQQVSAAMRLLMRAKGLSIADAGVLLQQAPPTRSSVDLLLASQ